ncbi:MAG: endonuclease/exonuclease/phosphatase family protein [Christensenellales bacterium]|jgi:endonuclease/exonuclease/phosphatase family metal-dependent hydrolase
MKRFISAIIILMTLCLFLIACCAGCKDKQEDESVFTVMSFNIRTAATEDDNNNLWTNRRQEVISLIKNRAPDLIGFQELSMIQYDFVEEALMEDYEIYKVYRGPFPFFNECSAIFYKKERFKLIDSQSFWLSETPDQISVGWDASTHRICSMVTLEDKVTGKVFSHFNTHLDHKGIIAREQSVYLLKERIASNNLPAILTGDFNFNEESDFYQNLVEGNLRDTKYLAPEKATDCGGTYNGFGKSHPKSPIDFIFTTENDFEVLSYKIIRDSYRPGYYPSDHFPVMATLKQL